MAWEGIEEKLSKALTVKISLPAGTIWLPASHLTIDDWLTSIAKTDEELRELNIPRIRFLQNRWPIINLMELEWDDEFSNRRAIAAMDVGQRAYILFSDWSQYQVIAAVEPKGKPSLYRAVIGKLLENRSFVPTRPTHIRYRRPDLLPELVPVSPTDSDKKESRVFGGEDFGGLEGSLDWMHPGSRPDERWKSFISDIFVGWIGKWLRQPEVGFSWHEDMPKSISSAEKGEIVMQYKPSYGDKQREAQKRKKEEQVQSGETLKSTTKQTDEIKADEKPSKREDKSGAA